MQTKPLSDIAEVFRPDLSSMMRDYGTSLLIRFPQISDEGIDFKDCRKVHCTSDYQHNHYRLRPDDILLSAEGCAIFPKVEGDYFPGPNVNVVRVKEDENGNKFYLPALLCAYLKLPKISNRIRTCYSGSVMLYLDLKQIREMPIPFLDDPSRAVLIADMIAHISSLIEVCKQRDITFVKLINAIVHRELVEGIPHVVDPSKAELDYSI